MNKGELGLMAAMKEECRLVLKWDGWRRLETGSGLTMYEREEREVRVRLVISGIGGARAMASLQTLLNGFSPRVVVSFGYGGALDPQLHVGDLVWGRQVFHWEEGRGGLTPGPDLACPPREILERPPGEVPWRMGCLVTADRLVEKERVSRQLEPQFAPATLDMETYALSKAMEDLGIPMIGLRAVSDELRLEISPIVSGWTDEALQIRASRITGDLLRHPGRIVFMIRLFRRSRMASRSLTKALRLLLDYWTKG